MIASKVLKLRLVTMMADGLELMRNRMRRPGVDMAEYYNRELQVSVLCAIRHNFNNGIVCIALDKLAML